ncbi:MAG TPA: DUF1259 domain-containing protein [Chondromyces sp.]|nr:DUF1259 domain-containing protein [Chondromyces sp.]
MSKKKCHKCGNENSSEDLSHDNFNDSNEFGNDFSNEAGHEVSNEFGNEFDNEFGNELGNEFDLNAELQGQPTSGGNISVSKCQQLADIIGGEVIQSTPVCVVMRLRDIGATILGRRTRSPLALPFMLSFENNGLNLGETVLRQGEVNPMLDALRRRGIIVTAFHNHWLFEEPRLMYMHWENVGMNPFEFASNSIAAAREAGLFKKKHL